MSTWAVYNFDGKVGRYQEVEATALRRENEWVMFLDEEYEVVDMFFRPIRVRKIS